MKKISFLFNFLIFSPLLMANPINLHSALTYDGNKITNLNIETTYENLEINETYGTDFSIEIYGNNNLLFPIITEDENKVTITSTQKVTTPGDICKIILYMPSEVKFQNIEIKTGKNTHNQININNVKTENMLIETINSDISCQYLRGNLDIKSVNGNITISDFTTTKSTFLSNHGKISLKNGEFSQISVLSQSNTIQIKNLFGEYILIKNNSGNIIADDFATDYFDIETATGNISISLKQAPFAASSIFSPFGFVQLFIPVSYDYNLNIHSNSGTLYDKISKIRLTPRQDYVKTFNQGGPVLSIKTFSGDIEVDKY